MFEQDQAINTTAMVLIGFGNSLSAPEVAWSLVGSGFRVAAFVKQGTHPALRKSRFVQLEYVTDPAISVHQTLGDLQNLVEKLRHPILMALDDESLWLIRELSKHLKVRVAAHARGQAQVTLDKRVQLAAALEAGFAVPDTWHMQSRADLSRISCFPVIVKPALAARALGGRLGRERSYFVADAGELVVLQQKWNVQEPMLAQPLLTGVGEGLFGLALDNRVLAWSGHRRVRMMNPMGSGSSACQSVKPDPQICAVAERFLNLIEWRGLFMIELLRDRQGQIWFMELNGRAWGSMALSRQMGFEYPAWAVRHLVDPAFVPPTPPDSAPVLCRHLGRELLHFLFVCRGAKSRAFCEWPSVLTTFRDVFSVKRSDTWYNRNQDDKRVFWADTWQTLISHLLRLRKPGV